MNRQLLLVMIGLILALNSPFPSLVALGLSLMGLGWYRHGIWVLLMFAVLITPHVRSWLPSGPDGVVSELNDRSALITNGSSKILISSVDSLLVGDRVILSGCDPLVKGTTPGDVGWNRYVDTHQIFATTTTDAITAIQRFPLMIWWVKQWDHTDGFKALVKVLLFQSDPTAHFGLILGTGLVFGLINRLLRSVFSLVLREPINAMVRFGLFALMAFYLGYPLSLLRYVVSLGCDLMITNRWIRWSVSVGVLWLLNPFYLTSMTVLIPLYFQLMGLLGVPAITRSLGFSVVQGLVWHRVNPVTTLAYGMLRHAFVGLILVLWVATIFPFCQPWVIVFVNLLDRLTSLLNQAWIVRGQAAIPSLVVLFSILRTTSRSPRWMTGGLVVFLLWLPRLSAPWFATVMVVDVGQGNAVLITAPFNQDVVLIDTGRPQAYSRIRSTLDAYGIDHLDALITTHDDADHAGNTEQLHTDYRVRKMITTPVDYKSSTLWLSALDASVENPTENQRSLVYGLKWGSTRWVLMGDADVANERMLLARYPRLRADVVLIGHHGSATSTSDAWIGSLQPQLALISVGRNAYGHPSSRVMTTLTSFHVPMMSTLEDGSLRMMITPWGTIIITDSWKLKILSGRV